MNTKYYNVEARNSLNGVQFLFYDKESRKLDLEIFFRVSDADYKTIRENFPKELQQLESDSTFTLIGLAFNYARRNGFPLTLNVGL